jgi:hypothetical protein
LKPTQINKLLEEVQALHPSAASIDALLGLAPQLPVPKRLTLVTEIWIEAQKLADPLTRARLFFRLAQLQHLFHDEQATPGVVSSIFEVAQTISNDEARIRSLSAIVQYVPHSLRTQTLARLFDDIDHLAGGRLRASLIAALAESVPIEFEDRVVDSAESIETPADRARTLISLALYLSPACQARLRTGALDTIRTIASEEDRAEALVAFAPLLEDLDGSDLLPDLKEQALAISAQFNRGYWRAKALVAFARHLSPELFATLLAAISQLSSEHDKAVLLAEIAPKLPDERLTDFLEVARAMQSADTRSFALTALARFAPDHWRQQLAAEALAQVPGVGHPFEQITALIALIEMLPTKLHEQILATALADVMRIENEHTRVRALTLLGPRLSAALLPRALDAAYQFSDPGARMSALSCLISVMDIQSRQDVLAHLLKSVLEIQKEFKRARALVSIAPLLSLELLHQVQVAAESLTDPFDRVIVYIALAQNLPPDQRPPIIGHAWTLIRHVENGYDASSAMAAIAPYLPDSMRNELLVTAREAIAAIRDEYDRASAIAILAPLLLADEGQADEAATADRYTALEAGLMAALEVSYQQIRTQLLEKGALIWAADDGVEQSYRLWRKVALRIAELSTVEASLCLAALFPAIRALAGEESMADIARSLFMR